MSTTITSQHVAPRGHVVGWFSTLLSGFRWGLEIRRRYDRERAAGRPVDEQAMRRIASEVDAWQGRLS